MSPRSMLCMLLPAKGHQLKRKKKNILLVFFLLISDIKMNHPDRNTEMETKIKMALQSKAENLRGRVFLSFMHWHQNFPHLYQALMMVLFRRDHGCLFYRMRFKLYWTIFCVRAVKHVGKRKYTFHSACFSHYRCISLLFYFRNGSNVEFIVLKHSILWTCEKFLVTKARGWQNWQTVEAAALFRFLPSYDSSIFSNFLRQSAFTTIRLYSRMMDPFMCGMKGESNYCATAEYF